MTSLLPAVQIRNRDKLDAQIEACVCDLFERMRALEFTNAELTQKLVSMGLVVRDGGASEEGLVADSTAAAKWTPV